MKEFLSTYKIQLILGLIIIGGAAFYLRSGEGKTETVYTAEKGIIEQKVVVTGKIKSNDDAQLSFEKSGTVSRVNVSEGDTVVSGKTLVSLNAADALAQVSRARAQYNAALAELERLQGGAREEEKSIKESGVQSANNSLSNAYNLGAESARSARQTIEDSIKTKNREFFILTSSDTYQVAMSTCDGDLANTLSTARKSIDSKFANLGSLKTSATPSEVEMFMQNTYTLGSAAKELLDNMNTYVTLPCVAASSTLDTYRNNISAARTSVQQALTDISQKQNQISSEKSALDRANKDLNLTLAGTESTKIRAQKAAVDQARSAVYEAEANYGKNLLKAPITGRITKVDVEPGELAQAGKVVVRIIGDGGYSVEANVTESDIAKIEVGDTAQVTIEAISTEKVFTGKVITIDSAENGTEGNPLYRIVVGFDEKYPELKSGMTAKTNIVTTTKEGVIKIPNRYVISRDGGKFVLVQTTSANGKATQLEKTVTTGIKSSDGFIEIVSGVSERDVVIAPPEEKNKKDQAK